LSLQSSLAFACQPQASTALLLHASNLSFVFASYVALAPLLLFDFHAITIMIMTGKDTK
jgi:hypothetical protein